MGNACSAQPRQNSNKPKSKTQSTSRVAAVHTSTTKIQEISTEEEHVETHPTSPPAQPSDSRIKSLSAIKESIGGVSAVETQSTMVHTETDFEDSEDPFMEPHIIVRATSDPVNQRQRKYHRSDPTWTFTVPILNSSSRIGLPENIISDYDWMGLWQVGDDESVWFVEAQSRDQPESSPIAFILRLNPENDPRLQLEAFVTKLAQRLNIPTLHTLVVDSKREGDEWNMVLQQIQSIGGSFISEKWSTTQQFVLYELVQDAKFLPNIHESTQFSNQSLVDLGRIIAFDIFVNNSSRRIHSVWALGDVPGNPETLIQYQDRIISVENRSMPLNSSNDIHRYQELLETFLKDDHLNILMNSTKKFFRNVFPKLQYSQSHCKIIHGGFFDLLKEIANVDCEEIIKELIGQVPSSEHVINQQFYSSVHNSIKAELENKV